MKSTTKLAVGDRASLVLRNWLLLYFSVKTKSSVHYNFLNIHIIFAALRIRAHADTASINQALHPNHSHWKRLYLRDQCNDSCYNVPRLCNAVWSRRFGAGFKLFYFPNISNIRISLTNLSFCNAYRTESLVPRGSIRICISLHPYIYIYIYIYSS